MRHLKFVVNCALVFSSMGAFTQDSARTVQYHSQDIVLIRAKCVPPRRNQQRRGNTRGQFQRRSAIHSHG